MSSTSSKVTWDASTFKNYEKILLQIPALIRGIAETRVSKKAEAIVREENRTEIAEKDMVAAFFAETPAGFIPAMKQSMKDLQIDYAGYGFAE